MKKAVLFKTLIDIIFYLYVIGLIAILLKSPFNLTKETNLEQPNFLYWLILAIDGICYFIFLRGLYFLRKMARIFLSEKYFTKTVAISMQSSGNQFIYAGLLSILGWTLGLIFNIAIDPSNTLRIIPLFIIIIGLFFTIQSKALLSAIEIKNENDLTV